MAPGPSRSYISHITWASTEAWLNHRTAEPCITRTSSHHSALRPRVYNADIGAGKYKYFGNMNVRGTKYVWGNVPGWYRL